MYRKNSAGFTLVELLVVISIIGILVGLVMPAMQAAQEAMRRRSCSSNLKNLGLAVTQHLDKWTTMPTGGWGPNWAGDPDRGFTSAQPGGWPYNILPYLELANLHDQGNNNSPQKRSLGCDAASKPVGVYICPTRRRVTTFAYSPKIPYTNIDAPSMIARCDYAINSGDTAPSDIATGPSSLSDGDGRSDWGPDSRGNGVCYLHSSVKSANVEDGLANTYLIGEKYLNSDDYITGNAKGDTQGWNAGYQFDTHRWVSVQPLRDRPNTVNYYSFGSAHPAGWNVVMCDGSIRTMNYRIDPETHRRLGVRNDHLPIDQSKLD